MGAAAAVIYRRKKNTIQKFINCSAIDPASAVHLEQLGLRHDFIIDLLLSGGTLIKTADDRYYLSSNPQTRHKQSGFHPFIFLVLAFVFITAFTIIITLYFK